MKHIRYMSEPVDASRFLLIQSMPGDIGGCVRFYTTSARHCVYYIPFKFLHCNLINIKNIMDDVGPIQFLFFVLIDAPKKRMFFIWLILFQWNNYFIPFNVLTRNLNKIPNIQFFLILFPSVFFSS